MATRNGADPQSDRLLHLNRTAHSIQDEKGLEFETTTASVWRIRFATRHKTSQRLLSNENWHSRKEEGVEVFKSRPRLIKSWDGAGCWRRGLAAPPQG